MTAIWYLYYSFLEVFIFNLNSSILYFQRIFFFLLLLSSFLFSNNTSTKKHLDFSISVANPSPLLLGLAYHHPIEASVFALTRLESMGFYFNADKFWLSVRGSGGISFFRERPAFMEIFLSGGYFYARRENKMHQDFNSIQKTSFLLPYSQKEFIDISIGASFHFFGFFVKNEVPIFYNEKYFSYLWAIGYSYSF